MTAIQSIKSIGYHFTASGIVLFDNKVLLIFHSKLDAWAQPGGHIEYGELPHEACLREIKEETGLSVQLHQDFAPPFLPNPIANQLVESSENNLKVLHYDFVYLCKPSEIEISYEPNSKCRWTDINELDNLNLAKNVKELVELARNCVNN